MTTPAIRPARIGRRDLTAYALIAVAAGTAVYLGNDDITQFFVVHSRLGYLLLFLTLPLLACLTRAVEVVPGERQRNVERAISIVYAIRNQHWRLIVKSVGLWLLWMTVVVLLVMGCISMALYRWSGGIANWSFLAAAGVLVWNLVPGRFHLAPGATFTVAIIAPPEIDRLAYAGLATLDKTIAGWSKATSESSDTAVNYLYGAVMGGKGAPPQPADKAITIYFSQPRPWSRMTGERSMPVDLVTPYVASGRSPGHFGILALLPRNLSELPDQAMRLIMQETTRFVTRPGKKQKKKKKKQHPDVLQATVAVVVDGDTVPEPLAASVRSYFEPLRVRGLEFFALPLDPAAHRADLTRSGAAGPLVFLISKSKAETQQRGSG